MTADSSDNATPDAAETNGAEAVAATQSLTINAQFIKDLSFEAPNSPAVLMTAQKSAPDIKINVDVQVGMVQEATFEVALNIHGECVMDGKTAFIVELTYGGLFTLNLPEERRKPVLLIECPRLLFPFARNVVADVTRDGGFPPLMLNPLDFAAMYRDGANKTPAEKPADA